MRIAAGFARAGMRLLTSLRTTRAYSFSGRMAMFYMVARIYAFQPDVVFLQDLSLFGLDALKSLKSKYVLAGQCSCRFEDDEKLKQFDVLFTSFPFYLDRFRKLGINGVFLPLAFDPLVL